MGEPVVPTQGEREYTLGLAIEIVDRVRNDEEPIKPSDLAVFRLAQDLVDVYKVLGHACKLLDDEGLEETAHKLRLLDLEGLGL